MIPRKSTRCVECNCLLKELYYSALQKGQRKDFCAACWGKSRKEARFFWQARPQRKKTFFNESQVERSSELFFDLIERPELVESEKTLLFVLALYLQRMRKIILKKEGKTKILYEANGQTFWVKKVDKIQKDALLQELSKELCSDTRAISKPSDQSLLPEVFDNHSLQGTN